MPEERLGSCPLRFNGSRREAMLEPEEVSAMLRLKELGWGTRRIARELGISRNTVRGCIAAGGRTPSLRSDSRIDQGQASRAFLRRVPDLASRAREVLRGHD